MLAPLEAAQYQCQASAHECQPFQNESNGFITIHRTQVEGIVLVSKGGMPPSPHSIEHGDQPENSVELQTPETETSDVIAVDLSSGGASSAVLSTVAVTTLVPVCDICLA